MTTILKNILPFSGLVVGVPVVLPHLLNINDVAVAPQIAEPKVGGFVVTADVTNVTVTRTTGPAAVDVYVEHWHTIESCLPPGSLAGLVPFVLNQGSGGAGSGGSILWAPGGGGDATTWDEVMAFIAASKAPIDVYVNANATIPAGLAPYEMNGANLISDPIIGSLTITVADGAQLNNLGSVEGQMILDVNATALTPLLFDAASGGSPNALILRFNGALQNSGTIPAIEVPAGMFFVLGMVFNATLLVPGVAPTINAGAGSVIIAGIFGTGTINDNWATGPVGSTLLYQNLGGAPSPLPTNAAFLGTTIQNVLLGVSCTGLATRPVNPFGALPVGTMVFDQSLGVTGLPIWWDGTQWVDATGAPA